MFLQGVAKAATGAYYRRVQRAKTALRKGIKTGLASPAPATLTSGRRGTGKLCASEVMAWWFRVSNVVVLDE